MRRIAIFVCAAVALVLALGAAALAWWLPSEAQLARMAEARAGKALGVPVTIGALHWSVLPRPMVELRDVATGQESAVEVDRIMVWPRLRPLLLHREIALERVEVDGATLPHKSMKAFKGNADPAGQFTVAELPLAELAFSDVELVNPRGIALKVYGKVDFDAGWRPRYAEVQRTGVEPPARMVLRRQGTNEDRWQVDIDVAGGTWNGDAALAPARGEGDAMRLTGTLEPKRIDLEGLMAALQRKPVVAGKLSGRTDIRAEGVDAAALLQSLHTRTRFSVAPATVLHFSFDEAIKTLGKQHKGGNTPLESLTGQLDTDNGADGVVLRYTDLTARSGALTATGSATIANRRIDATLAVDLVDGLVGVPLRITGDVTKPQVSVPAGALAGAAVGTAVLPGIGTAIGARIGGFFSHLLGGGDDEAPKAGTGGQAKPKRSTAPAPSR